MQFFFYEIVARIVAAWLAYDCGVQLYNGIVERKITYRLGRSTDWVDLLLVTIAMVSGRTFAMAANRILDRRIDALNPRTAGRQRIGIRDDEMLDRLLSRRQMVR